MAKKSMADPTPLQLPPQRGESRIVWKVVKPKHYLRAMELKNDEESGGADYVAYLCSLVERWDFVDQTGAPIPVGQAQGLDADQLGRMIEAFNALFDEAR